MQNELSYRQVYYTPDIMNFNMYHMGVWYGTDIDYLLLKRNAVFKTPLEAVNACEKMLKVLEVKTNV